MSRTPSWKTSRSAWRCKWLVCVVRGSPLPRKALASVWFALLHLSSSLCAPDFSGRHVSPFAGLRQVIAFSVCSIRSWIRKRRYFWMAVRNAQPRRHALPVHPVSCASHFQGYSGLGRRAFHDRFVAVNIAPTSAWQPLTAWSCSTRYVESEWIGFAV